MKPEQNVLWNTVFAKNNQVVYRKIADETLLVPIRGKLADMQQIFALNPVAEFIWQQLDGRQSLATICDRVLEEFEVERPQAETDILEFLQELQQSGLVQEKQ